MAIEYLQDQFRTIDPYTQRVFEHGDPPTEDSRVYLSRASNLLTKAIGNDVVLNGMRVSGVIEPGSRSLTFTVGEGTAIVDSTIIEITEGNTASVTFVNANNYDPLANGNFFLLFLSYQYLETLENNQAALKCVFYDSVADKVFPLLEAIDLNVDRVLLAAIEFSKLGGFLNDFTIYDTYYTNPGDCADRFVDLDIFSLPTPIRYYLGGWGEKPQPDEDWGGMNMSDFFRAQCEIGGRDGRGNLLVKSPNGKRWIITVDDSGNLSTEQDPVQVGLGCP